MTGVTGVRERGHPRASPSAGTPVLSEVMKRTVDAQFPQRLARAARVEGDQMGV
jgi:hypothetical protein